MKHTSHNTLIGLCAALTCLAPSAQALVTSDGPGTHVLSPGTPAFGLLDHEGVGLLTVSYSDSTTGFATASLLADGGGLFALTAAHVLADGVGFTVTGASVTWMTSSGPVTAPLLTRHLDPSFDGITPHGHDVALIEFGAPIPLAVPRYELDRTPGDELGALGLVVGYGNTGEGSTGSTITTTVKRGGFNEFESFGLGSLGVAGTMNDSQQLTFDFDSGAVANDGFGFFFGTSGPFAAGGDPAFDDAAGFGGDEVMTAVSDSGGPTFHFDGSIWRIAGVHSYVTRLTSLDGGTTIAPLETSGGLSSDISPLVNSSFGEFGVDARVSDPALLGFIDSVVVPEPSTALLSAIGVLGVLLRRKRHHRSAS